MCLAHKYPLSMLTVLTETNPNRYKYVITDGIDTTWEVGDNRIYQGFFLPTDHD
jgi:hypothetical protein